MVSSASIIAFIVNIVICFGMPLGCLLYLLIRRKRAFLPFLVGASVFVVFQLIIRIPLINYALAPMGWYQEMTQSPWLYGIFLGLTAGLFEELGRFAGYKTLLKGRDRWIDGFAFGVGHGGIEAMLLVGMTNIGNLVLSLMINNGQFSQVSAAIPADAAAQLLSQMTALQPFDIYLGGIERIFAFTIQIALSILVLMAVRKRSALILIAAILVHMIIDAPVVIFPQVFGWNIYNTEIFVGVIAVLALVFIILSRRSWRDKDVPTPVIEPAGTDQL